MSVATSNAPDMSIADVRLGFVDSPAANRCSSPKLTASTRISAQHPESHLRLTSIVTSWSAVLSSTKGGVSIIEVSVPGL